MFGKAQVEPCPLCTMWIDGYNAAAPHLAENVDFAVVAAAEPRAIRSHAEVRGWNNLRLLSARNTTFKYDLGSEEADGAQTEWISVFTLGGDGTVRHLYSKGAQMADDRRERGIDLLSPVWHLLDLTPDGRGDWYPSLNYYRRFAIERSVTGWVSPFAGKGRSKNPNRTAGSISLRAAGSRVRSWRCRER